MVSPAMLGHAMLSLQSYEQYAMVSKWLGIEAAKSLFLEVDAKGFYNLLSAEQRLIGSFSNIGFLSRKLLTEIGMFR